jgi:hypothetical protein
MLLTNQKTINYEIYNTHERKPPLSFASTKIKQKSMFFCLKIEFNTTFAKN